MKTKNLEKEIEIEIIASILENRFLIAETDAKKVKDFEQKLYESCTFITGENVHFGNLYRIIPIVKSMIREQYPYIINVSDFEIKTIDFKTINNIINYYKTTYGDKLIIKSVKKGIVKTLKIQDNYEYL